MPRTLLALVRCCLLRRLRGLAVGIRLQVVPHTHCSPRHPPIIEYDAIL